MISVVSPIYGCNSCLVELCGRLIHTLGEIGEDFEIILVDDASPDDAWPTIVSLAASDKRIRGIRLSRNFGQHYAISAGVESARGHHVIVIDCDLQDRPEAISSLVEKARQGFDVVFAQRADRQDSIFKRLASQFFYRMLSYLTSTPYDHSIANFGVYSRKVVDTLKRMPESERCFPLMVKWTGFRSAAVPVAHDKRQAGRSSYNVRKLIRLAMNIVLSYSDKPLRLVVKLGMLFSLLATFIVALSVYAYLSGRIAMAGYASIIASIWLLGSVIVFCIGIVGLYIGQLFQNAKGRPYYIIDERVNEPPSLVQETNPGKRA